MFHILNYELLQGFPKTLWMDFESECVSFTTNFQLKQMAAASLIGPLVANLSSPSLRQPRKWNQYILIGNVTVHNHYKKATWSKVKALYFSLRY